MNMHQQTSVTPPKKQRQTIFFVLLGIYCFIMAQALLPLPSLRFLVTWWNSLIFTVAQFIPPILFAFAATWPLGRKRLIALVCSLILTFPALFFGFCGLVDTLSSNMYQHTVDPSFESIHQTLTEHGNVIVYRTNGGATTSFGIVVRQECEIGLGLKIVKTHDSRYRTADANVEIISETKIRVTYPPEYAVKPETYALVGFPC